MTDTSHGKATADELQRRVMTDRRIRRRVAGGEVDKNLRASLTRYREALETTLPAGKMQLRALRAKLVQTRSDAEQWYVERNMAWLDLIAAYDRIAELTSQVDKLKASF